MKKNNLKGIFVTGIGTDVGKTISSAVLVEALKCDYWKPLQAGNLDYADSDVIRQLISNDDSVIHKEAIRLIEPCAPSVAAKKENVNVSISDMLVPESDNLLIVEGAGGLLVPFNKSELVIDLISQLKIPVILVSRNYLGSINHTLLSIESLNARKIPILGLVFFGDSNPETESLIEEQSKLRVIGRIPLQEVYSKSDIASLAKEFSEGLHEYL